jgi:hypothetical protein
MRNYSDMSGSRTSDWLLQTLKSNPEGLLLLGAACTLLFRSGRSRTQSHAGGTYRPSHDQWQEGASNQGTATQWAQGASRAADTARDYVSSAGKTVSDTAAGYAAAVSEYAQDTSQQVLEQSRRMADQAQTRVQNVVQEQPLAVALAGIAAGAVVAAAFPATRWERRTLGPAGRQISEAAQSAREKITEATTAAGERLMSAAQQRGLNAEGLKEVAREVAGAVTGEQKSQHSAATERPGGSQSVSGAPGRTTQSGTSSSASWPGSNNPGQR